MELLVQLVQQDILLAVVAADLMVVVNLELRELLALAVADLAEDLHVMLADQQEQQTLAAAVEAEENLQLLHQELQVDQELL
jgi:hypothetical protein